ncbi:MAG TPA: response regulator [Allosphingosinicella sp.]|nr:response regulator [Allosphingosinicella sp.]
MSTAGDTTPDAFLVIAPAGRDARVIGELLASARLAHQPDPDGAKLLEALASGETAGAIVTDDAWARIDSPELREAIEAQPPWSDFPFVLLTRRGETRQGSRSLEDLVNVTILERPLHPASLISAARSALRGRMRQRLAAQHLHDLEMARTELRDLANTLEAKVEERTRDLAGANDRLTAEIAEREKAEARLVQAQKMEAVGQLTGGLAHDFNNLLTAVVGSLDLLLRRTDDEKLRRLASNALQAAERGAQLTAQLLAFSRRQRLTPTPINPNEILSGMGDLLARTIGPQVRVETRLDPNIWHALADRTQFEVMILNLAINARDAMPSGGRLTVATRNFEHVPPNLAAELRPGSYVAVSVSDTGTGMSSEVIGRAFEPFFTTKEQGKGTGLGLSQLYGFAKQSGGTAKIDSVEGQGTTVTIYLPRTQAEAEAGEAEIFEPKPRGRLPILLVDDDDSVREVAETMLDEIGYEVTAVAGGAAALQLLEARSFALLLTDVAMPGMTGVELAQRAREIAPGMPVLFASGYADLQAFGKQLSEESLLKKPYRMTDLHLRIDSALNSGSRNNVIELKR